MRRIIDQHQMRQPDRRGWQADEGIIGPHIAVDHQKRLRTEQRQGLEDAAAGFQCVGRLRGIDDTQSPCSAITQYRRQLRAQMAGIDHQFGDARRP